MFVIIPHWFQVSVFHLASSHMLLRGSIDYVASDCDMDIVFGFSQERLFAARSAKFQPKAQDAKGCLFGEL